VKTTQPPVRHLAIIPDGNRRWAKKHAIAAQLKIYEHGSDKTFEILEEALGQYIPYVTLWASSYANLAKRPVGFVNAIEAIYARKFRELAKLKLVHDNQVRVEIYGSWRELLKPETAAALQESIDATASYNKQVLTILVGYDGHHERGAATLAMLNDALAGSVRVPQDIAAAENLLRSYAWTGQLPDVDLIIRTGAWEDPHNSAAFLSLLTGEAQYAFPPVLWPDLTTNMLNSILEDFAQRERRLGR
jgi:undecaprenyl diphosphate synthase